MRSSVGVQLVLYYELRINDVHVYQALTSLRELVNHEYHQHHYQTSTIIINTAIPIKQK